MKSDPSVSIQELYDAPRQFFDVSYQRGIEDVFSLLIGGFLWHFRLYPFIMWWRFLDKNRIMEVSFVGLSIAIIATTIDIFGHVFLFWQITKYKTFLSCISATKAWR